jgi:hypothetical protein
VPPLLPQLARMIRLRKNEAKGVIGEAMLPTKMNLSNNSNLSKGLISKCNGSNKRSTNNLLQIPMP